MGSEENDAEFSTLVGRASEPTQPAAAFVLSAIEGPDKGISIAIDGACPTRMLVGQSPACDVRLTDREASRRHLTLEVVGGKLRVTDLGSKNGTYVDRLSIGEANLDGGETIRIGTNLIRVTRMDVVPRAELPAATSFGRVIGASREMRQLYTLCTRLAALDLPIILDGEPGSSIVPIRSASS